MGGQHFDLRAWLQQVDAMGELETVEGADRDEIGAICETWGSGAQALMFDKVKGFKAGHRVLTCATNSPNRICASFGIEPVAGKQQLVEALQAKFTQLKPVPPKLVATGPVLENVVVGSKVNLNEFPAPLWHKEDGGHYIGTGDMGITRDPDTGWVNFGCYRAVVHDAKSTGIVISRGHHGWMTIKKYWDKGEPCPMALCVGEHPLLYMMSGIDVPHGVSEYDWAGGLGGHPVPVVAGPVTGLPIPAYGELVLEGELLPNEIKDEGPFGEWAGYYTTNVSVPRPVLHVKGVTYRNEPIIFGAPPGRLPSDNTYYFSPIRSALVCNELTRAGIPGVVGAWEHECGGGRMFLVVSIKQQYPGHSAQVAMMAASCWPAAYANRVTIVVDDDIAPHDLSQVMWVVATRADFKNGITVMHKTWTSPADPTHYAPEHPLDLFNSRLILNATRPYELHEKFPAVCGLSEGERQVLTSKWSELFGRKRVVG